MYCEGVNLSGDRRVLGGCGAGTGVPNNDSVAACAQS